MENRIKKSHNNPLNLRLSISSSALKTIESESAKATSVETGGVVAGITSIDDEEVILTHASKPGLHAVAGKHSFQHDSQYCQKFLDSLARKTNGKIDYLGEWHKHFEPNPKPSFIDIRTMSRIANNPNYHISIPLLLIIGVSNSKADLKIFTVNRKSECISIKWEITDTVSVKAK